MNLPSYKQILTKTPNNLQIYNLYLVYWYRFFGKALNPGAKPRRNTTQQTTLSTHHNLTQRIKGLVGF